MATWPASLPQDPLMGLQESRQDARLRTSMDAGPTKLRRRFTSASRFVKCSVHLTGTQRATLDTFYETTLGEGVTAFDWTDPRDGTTVSFRFNAPIEYEIALPHPTPASREWRAALDLEILP